MARNVGTKSSGLEGLLKSAQSHQKEYETPKGLSKLRGRDKVRWTSFCLARDDWTESELEGLYEGVLALGDLDACRVLCEGAPIMVEKANGEMMANPIFPELRSRQKAARDQLRAVGLQISAERTKSTLSGGKRSKPGVKDEPLPDNVKSLLG